MRHQMRRDIGILVLLALLCGLLVWAGTVKPDPTENRYPETDDLLTDYDRYVGQCTQIGGTVVSTDPVIIELSNEIDTRHITVRGVHRDVTADESLVVFGRVRPNSVIDAGGVITREPWEQWYMYAVSVIGGLWVLGRLLNRWQFNRRTWTVEPRETPRVTWRGGDDA
ncbi:hypothetical protein [Halopenitus persicus]|uniref:hypothetical protein n=1 Tax=Halopenitus persicus TaxID=1048396 RepID=UPI000B889449|nr:hypothetical protein [Halopenitus persicus]